MNRIEGVTMRTQENNLLKWILVSIILFGIFLLWNSNAFSQDWTAEQKEVWVKHGNKWLQISSFSASCGKTPPCPYSW
jgi:hypothetical protein